MILFGQYAAKQRIYECPECNALVSYKDNFCTNCGVQIDDSAYAKKPIQKISHLFDFKQIKKYNSPCCNKSLIEGDKYCWKCGKNFTPGDVSKMIAKENKSMAIALIISVIILVVFVTIFSG